MLKRFVSTGLIGLIAVAGVLATSLPAAAAPSLSTTTGSPLQFPPGGASPAISYSGSGFAAVNNVSVIFLSLSASSNPSDTSDRWAVTSCSGSATLATCGITLTLNGTQLAPGTGVMSTGNRFIILLPSNIFITSADVQFDAGIATVGAQGTTAYTIIEVDTESVALALGIVGFAYSFDANGGQGSVGSLVSASGAVAPSGSSLTRSGYTFMGWASTPNATSATYAAGASLPLLTVSDEQLYAVWSADPVQLAATGAASTASLLGATAALVLLGAMLMVIRRKPAH